ncbi:thioredoxin family protein [Laceyella sacchari]|uniref:Peroxiredoxin n=2 Tax=Laceyella TaxID=292635 RepID=A0AA45WNN9_9BACL|nr:MULTISPECIES: thioredoxin family protein [Laceyella]AUS08870.1 thioredoxin family protein [Laceyella sacchari]PRZ12857.1 peroxiredoxin [Laceyella sediminis]SMP18753.1 Peroxiredoxin [Laceyella tengchongensis]
MALTESNMFPLGATAPSFTLPDVVSNQEVSLEALKSDVATVIMFICNHCPYVKHVQKQLVQLANDYLPKGVAFIAISSNDAVQYPEDGPDNMKKVAEEFQYPFPYLYDESQKVAKDYQAACTPDFYIFDGKLSCVYRGQLDDSRPGNGLPVTGSYIRAALDSILNNEPIQVQQKPSIGCNIKWK